jgi:hypothetical protein
MDQKFFIALSLFMIASAATVFSQTGRETVIFGSRGSGGETSPFISLLRNRQNPVYPEDVLIGALHRRGIYGEELDLLAEKLERFFIDKEGEEVLVAKETLRAFRRIDASMSRADRMEWEGGGLRSVRIGRFTVRPSGREASAAIRFTYDAEEHTGTLFFEYNVGSGWQIIGADFNIFRPGERSENGQYSWEN